MRRPKSISEVATYRYERPEIPAWKPHCEFLDDFYEAGADPSMLAEESDAPIDAREAAYLAAAAGYLS